MGSPIITCLMSSIPCLVQGGCQECSHQLPTFHSSSPLSTAQSSFSIFYSHQCNLSQSPHHIVTPKLHPLTLIIKLIPHASPSTFTLIPSPSPLQLQHLPSTFIINKCPPNFILINLSSTFSLSPHSQPFQPPLHHQPSIHTQSIISGNP